MVNKLWGKPTSGLFIAPFWHDVYFNEEYLFIGMKIIVCFKMSRCTHPLTLGFSCQSYELQAKYLTPNIFIQEITPLVFTLLEQFTAIGKVCRLLSSSI